MNRVGMTAYCRSGVVVSIISLNSQKAPLGKTAIPIVQMISQGLERGEVTRYSSHSWEEM